MQCPFCRKETVWDYDNFLCQSCGRTIPEPPDVYDAAVSKAIEATQLRETLNTEKMRGYDNGSVLGGLEELADDWSDIAGHGAVIGYQTKLIDYIANLLEQYDILDIATRQSVIQNILYVLDYNGRTPTTPKSETRQYIERYNPPGAWKFSAVYGGGHGGLDYYGRTLKRPKNLAGNLFVDPQEGMTFHTTNTFSPRTIRILWSNFKKAEVVTEPPGCLNFWASPTYYLRIHHKPKNQNSFFTPEVGIIQFYVDRVQECGNLINDFGTEYMQKEEQNERRYQNFVETQQLDALPPRRFEVLVKDLFERMGYIAELTKITADGGVDLVLSKDKEKFVVQCKRYKGRVGQPILRDLLGTMVHEGAVKGFLVTTGEFTKPAIKWAEGKNIDLIDKYKLAEWLEIYLGKTNSS